MLRAVTTRCRMVSGDLALRLPSEILVRNRRDINLKISAVHQGAGDFGHVPLDLGRRAEAFAPEIVCKVTRTSLVAILPCCHLTLTGPRPKPACYPNEFNILGDHIRKARLDRGQLQEHAAKEIGVNKTTICRETNRVAPTVRNGPAIVRFLGYTPYRTPGHFGDWLHMVRTAFGVSEKAGAGLLNVDETTLAKWERGWHCPMRRSLQRIQFRLRIGPGDIDGST